jgi:hypothetical protein
VIARALIGAVACTALLLGPGPAAGAGDTVRLTVTFARTPGARQVAHLRCAGSAARADGFLRGVGASRACATARRLATFLASRPPAHRACGQLFAGPERALVTGTIGRRHVRRSFARTDACKTADWRRAMPLLPRPR